MHTKRGAKAGRPKGDHAKRQQQIAHALLRVIGEYGFDKATMRLVAREASCTTGVLTHYFDTKTDLVCSAIDILFDWAEQLARTAAAGGESLKALQVVAGISGEGERPPFDFWAVWLQVLAKAGQSRRLSQAVRKRYGRFRDLLTEIIREGQRRKQIRSDISADLLADHINAVSDGLGLMAPIESTRLTSERIRQLMKISVDLLRPS